MTYRKFYVGLLKNPLLDRSKSRWQRSTILKIIVKSPCISTKKSSDFDEIWYITAHLELDDSQMTKCEHFKIQDGGRPPF